MSSAELARLSYTDGVRAIAAKTLFVTRLHFIPVLVHERIPFFILAPIIRSAITRV
jgi:hypothetical protein